MLSGPGLVFVGERDCKVELVQVDESSLGPGEVVVDLEVSIISAGTEVANFTGLDPRTRVPGSWNEYPWRPGYGAVGNIVAVGPPATGPDRGLAVGDRVFAICRHARYAIADTVRRPIVKISADDDAQTIVLGRMASVSITALRKATTIDLGARGVVVGLGLVGNFAAQLMQLSGMKVLGLDPVEGRVAMARATGLEAALATAGSERATVVSALGAGGDLVVEASGVPDAVPTAVALARDGGEVVLLGSPRGVYGGDATDMLYQVHSRGIRLLGALEWLLPLDSGPWQARWSLQDDYATLFDLLRRGQLNTTGLVTHVVPPAQAQDIYSRLADREPGMGAVLFDWRTGSEPR
jgi:2-desacetyl-2-hydroxyethyl bacteriochlorophyllide A dehydrogenase